MKEDGKESVFSGAINWIDPKLEFWGEDDSKLTDANIDWIKSLGFDLSEAFKTTADFAVKQLSEGGDGTHPDRFALPILYLYRHSFELQLKEIIQYGLKLRLLQRSGKLEKLLTQEHSLKKLWNRAKKVLEGVWPKGSKAEIKQIESYLQILDGIDPDGQRFRYDNFPKLNEDGKPKLRAVETLRRRFGLLVLADRADKLHGFFQGAIYGLSELLSCQPSLSDYV